MNNNSTEPVLTYMQQMDLKMRNLLLEYECQPILFIGSGMSKRYFGAPGWIELLREATKEIQSISHRFEYFVQKHNNSAIEIGTELSDLVFEWAWNEGKNKFPSEFFQPDAGLKRDFFLKSLICKYLASKTPSTKREFKIFPQEIGGLEAIRPHAVITTNYDLSLEVLLDGYLPITGQTIIRYNTNSFGEIFHIHGDTNDPSSIVLTRDDYDEWIEKKKYISAKLLTYFAEHPVFIFGYGLGDENVKSILCDIGELVADGSGLINNVFQIIWQEKIPDHLQERVIIGAGKREFQINAIYANDFRWIFEALKSRSALTSVNLKLVRALAARTMNLIRKDIPSGNVQVNYDVLERVANNETELPTLLGIAAASNPNQTHPLTITQVAQRLGYKHWSGANKLVNKVKEDKGIDLKSSDNAYHCKIKTGPAKNSVARKWSLKAVDLLALVRDGRDYEIEIPT